MRGIAELLRLYRSKVNGDHMANVAAGDSLSASDAGRRNVDGWPGVQLVGVRFLHAVRGRGGGNGVIHGSGHEGHPKPPPAKPLPPRPRPSPPRPTRGFPFWAKLIVGSVFTLLLAFWTPDWGTLLRIGGEAEVAMKEAEHVAEVMEKAATVVEKVSEEVATQFPVDNKIKQAALIVEHVSKEAAKDAHIVEDFIHKVEEMKQDLDDIDKIVEPIIEKIVDEKAKTSIHK